jgi:peptidyl-Lys metalloendopeptidase
MLLNKLTKISLALLTALACHSALAAQPGVAVAISPAKLVLQANDNVLFNVTLSNSGNTDQLVLKWHTPFDDDSNSLFEVLRDGVKVPYQGDRVKRAKPQAADYFVLKAGKSYQQQVELSALYDMSVRGNYQIRYRVAGAGLQSETINLFIHGRNAQPVAAAPTLRQVINTTLTGTLSTTSCSASQIADITTAVANAKTYASGALGYMNAAVAGPRYTTWFGVNDAPRFSTVTNHYNLILDAFNNKDVVVSCKCRKSYYAYVNPGSPYIINVCNAFWTAPATGTDSKAGTLIHEMSHFNVVAGTDDWAYGKTAAKSLAISDPAKAIDNADSHEYFAENTPFQN